MTHYMIFPSITVLLYTCMIFSDYHILSIIIFCVWLLRLLSLKKYKVLMITLVIVCLASIRFYFYQQLDQSELQGEETEFLIEVDKLSLKIDGDQIQFYGKIIETNASQDINENIAVFYTIQTEEEKSKLEAHNFPELISVSGELEVPNIHRNFNQFDYQNFLNSKHIYWVLYGNEYKGIKEYNHHPFHYSQWRYHLLSWVDTHLPKKIAQYVNMLLFADMRSLSGEMQNHFSDLGIIHMVSISGMNIALLLNMFRYLLLRIGITRERIPYILLFFLPVYGILTGLGTSVFRAIVQHGLRAIGQIHRLSFDSLDYWSMTLILALLIEPQQIFYAGFQFSYALSFALYMLNTFSILDKVPDVCKDIVISGILSFVSIPILTYHYFEIPWYSLLANSLFAPFFSYFLLPGSILALFIVIIPCEPMKLFFYKIFESGITFFEYLVNQMGQWPNLTFITGRLSIVFMIMLIIAILLLFISCEKKKINKLQFVLSLLVIAISILSNKFPFSERVIMLDVGQGDAILHLEPFMKKTTLIDTGGQIPFDENEWQKKAEPYRLGEKILVPTLKSLGVSEIDYLIISHGDIDHMGEIDVLMEEIAIKNIVISNQTESILKENEAYQDVFEKNLIVLEEEDRIMLENKLYVFAPQTVNTSSQSKNNGSLITYGSVQDDYWLFTGDIEESSEIAMIKSFPNLKVDILKVAHHGSNTSTTEKFLKYYQPKEALISVGKNNWYGHPHPDVISRLIEHQVNIYRTDIHGAICYEYSIVSKNKIIKTVLQEEE